MLAIIVLFAFIVDSGVLNTPIDKLLCYVAQATCLGSPRTVPVKPIKPAPTLIVEKDTASEEVRIAFVDWRVEIRYGERADGEMPFSVHQAETRLAEK
jgi:hypothetical protein